MSLALLTLIFATGFVVMTPIGPVSTMCIRRSLVYGRRAGIAAGAGDAAAVAAYATIGATGSTLVPRFFAPYAVWTHVAVAFALVAIASLCWRARPDLPNATMQGHSGLAAGFGAALAIALANPADIVFFAALFAGLGVTVHTPLQLAMFFLTVFGGGCAYWVAMALVLERWRAELTTMRMRWLNRACSAFMLVGAAASIASLVKLPV